MAKTEQTDGKNPQADFFGLMALGLMALAILSALIVLYAALTMG